jgi:hypothetical protein
MGEYGLDSGTGPFGFHNILGNSGKGAGLAASQEGLNSMEIFIKIVSRYKQVNSTLNLNCYGFGLLGRDTV